MRHEAFHELEEFRRRFHERSFPHAWARVVNDVGLATLDMRAERCLNEFIGMNSYAARVVEELRRLVRMCDQVLPALPDEPRAYFGELRALLAASLDLGERLRDFTGR